MRWKGAVTERVKGAHALSRREAIDQRRPPTETQEGNRELNKEEAMDGAGLRSSFAIGGERTKIQFPEFEFVVEDAQENETDHRKTNAARTSTP
jgi:hypothetical protein